MFFYHSCGPMLKAPQVNEDIDEFQCMIVCFTILFSRGESLKVEDANYGLRNDCKIQEPHVTSICPSS